MIFMCQEVLFFSCLLPPHNSNVKNCKNCLSCGQYKNRHVTPIIADCVLKCPIIYIVKNRKQWKVTPFCRNSMGCCEKKNYFQIVQGSIWVTVANDIGILPSRLTFCFLKRNEFLQYLGPSLPFALETSALIYKSSLEFVFS